MYKGVQTLVPTSVIRLPGNTSDYWRSRVESEPGTGRTKIKISMASKKQNTTFPRSGGGWGRRGSILGGMSPCK